MSERISPRKAAAICGIGTRALLAHAKRGEIPGAARLFDGGNWTFDERVLRAYVKEREETACQGTSTASRAAKSGMPEYKFEDMSTASLYEQLMREKHGAALVARLSELNKSGGLAKLVIRGKMRSSSGRATRSKASNPQP